MSVTFACLTATILFAIQSGEVTVSLYFSLFFPLDIRPPAPLRALSRWCAGGRKVSDGDTIFHLAHDYDNPVEKLPRVWQAYLAVKRQQGPTERKHPVAPEMCDWLDRRQAGLGLVGAIIFLGCRCSEYLGPNIHCD